MSKHEFITILCICLVFLLGYLYVRRRPKALMHGTPIEETPPGKLYEQITRECPDCKEPAMWLIGPRGGIAVNIKCGHCGAWFNIADFGWAERIDP